MCGSPVSPQLLEQRSRALWGPHPRICCLPLASMGSEGPTLSSFFFLSPLAAGVTSVLAGDPSRGQATVVSQAPALGAREIRYGPLSGFCGEVWVFRMMREVN